MVCTMFVGCGIDFSNGSKTTPTKSTNTVPAPAPTPTPTPTTNTTNSGTQNNNNLNTNTQDYIKVPVTMINDTDVDFTELYASGSALNRWGSNLVNTGDFAPGGNLYLTFNIVPSNSKWDFKAVDYQGSSLTFTGLDLANCSTNGIIITLTYDRATNTPIITAK